MTVDLKEKFSMFDDNWTPKIVSEMDDYHVKLAHFHGEFTWHSHETDELFYVFSGQMSIEFEDHTVDLQAGQLYVVKSHVKHKPFAKEKCQVMLIEPKGTMNTGKEESDLRVEEPEWL